MAFIVSSNCNCRSNNLLLLLQKLDVLKLQVNKKDIVLLKQWQATILLGTVLSYFYSISVANTFVEPLSYCVFYIFFTSIISTPTFLLFFLTHKLLNHKHILLVKSIQFLVVLSGIYLTSYYLIQSLMHELTIWFVVAAFIVIFHKEIMEKILFNFGKKS